ncbi:hypothetical protein IWZ00DRAFT_545581 [Phyllosticta capitalensis]
MDPMNTAHSGRPVPQSQQTDLPNNIGAQTDPPRQVAGSDLQATCLLALEENPWATSELQAVPMERSYANHPGIPRARQTPGAERRDAGMQQMENGVRHQQQQEQEQRQAQQAWLGGTSELHAVPMERSDAHHPGIPPARQTPVAEWQPRRPLPENWAHLEDWIKQQRPTFQGVLDLCLTIEEKDKIDISKIINYEEPEDEVESPGQEPSDAETLNGSMGRLSLV